MKIVYFIDHLRGDGTQHVLTQLAAGLSARGHTQAVVCLNDSWDAPVLHDLRQTPAQVRVVGKAALASGIGFASLWRWLRAERFDVAVTLLFAADVIGRALAHSAGVPRIVSSLRARNANYTGWQRWLVRATMRWANAVIINNASVRVFAMVEEGAPAERIHVIPNGIDVELYRQPADRAALRAEFGWASATRLIGSVGRLTHQKGYDTLLEALALLSAPDVCLILIGNGEDEARLRAQALRLGLERRVGFAGYRRDVANLLGALDLYVQPSRFEGMPNALLEAMAAGCPIVASAVDGNRELIADGVHGWLVPPEDAGELAGTLHEALTNPADASRHGTAATVRANENFSLSHMISSWEAAMRYESNAAS